MLKGNAFKDFFSTARHRCAVLFFLIGCIFSFYAWLVHHAITPRFPTPEVPLLFYSNQTRQDLKLLFSHAIKQANNSIHLSVYGITDPDILSLLSSQAEEGVAITIDYDKTASLNLQKKLPGTVNAIPSISKGLMHRKILIFDQSLTFLSSANLTPASLNHHDNFVLGIHSPPLATFLRNPTSCFFSTSLNSQNASLYLLPDPQQLGLTQLIHTLNAAQKSIRIAMFTLTHPEITQALIQAKQRGVTIEIAVDYFTGRGASKKTLQALQEAHITTLLSQGRELLHHKWALIDDTTLITGSANWTKAAFTKNHDFLLFLSPLHAEQQRFMHKLWKMLSSEGTAVK